MRAANCARFAATESGMHPMVSMGGVGAAVHAVRAELNALV